jgi:DNA-directed RNA polymerase specialized sigma24 family protein
LRAIEAGEPKKDVMTAMDQLPENQKGAVLLRVNEKRSYAESSKVLSASLTGEESLCFRARSRFEQLLKRKSKE